MPAQQKALVLTAKQGPFAVQIIDVPKPASGELLIKIQATALNPVDWKIQAYGIFIEKFPAVIGSDIAGTVEELGEGVTGFAKGDRVLTQGVIGVNEHSGFQQYTLGNADVTAKIPDNISFEQASTIPLGLATAAVGLYSKNNAALSPPPWEDVGLTKYKSQPFVVLGGSSSVGQYVIQLAKLSGFSPLITTASPHNAAALKQLGATHVIDRNLPLSVLLAEVSKITSAPVTTIYDAVSLPETQNAGYELLASGGTLVLVLQDAVDPAKKTDDKRITNVFGNVNVPQNRAFGASLYSKLTELIAQGSIRPNHVETLPNGLEGIIGGLEKLRKGVSAVKLVGLPQNTA